MEPPRARVNSMRIQFGRGTSEPKDDEIFSFFKSALKLACEELLCMYREQSEFCIYVKFKTEELLQTTLDRLPGSVTFNYHNGASIPVTLSSATSTFKYVRLFNIPPEIEDREIAIVLAKYGKIQRLVREKYSAETGFPIWSGVRGVHMEITSDIPAALHVRNYQARVFYPGMKNKCFLCGSLEHQKAECPNRQSTNLRTAGTSFKDVLAGPSRWKQVNKDEKQPEQSQMVVIGKLNPRQRAERVTALQKVRETVEKGGRNEVLNQHDAVCGDAHHEAIFTSPDVSVGAEAAIAEVSDISEPATIVDVAAGVDFAIAAENTEVPESMEVWKVQERKRGRSRKVEKPVMDGDSLSESDLSTTEAKKSARIETVPNSQKFLRPQAMITRARSRSRQERSEEKERKKSA